MKKIPKPMEFQEATPDNRPPEWTQVVVVGYTGSIYEATVLPDGTLNLVHGGYLKQLTWDYIDSFAVVEWEADNGTM
jgi:hypothetical protein